MPVQQLAVFVENRRGRIKELTEALAQGNIDLLTLTIADTNDFGILRLVTRDNAKAFKILQEAGFMVTVVNLIGVEVADEAGGLNRVLGVLFDAGTNIEYIYSFAHTTDGKAIILFKANDEALALDALRKNNVKFIDKLID